MKLFGIIVLVAGLLLGAHALTMDVGVDVPARDFGYGIATPAMRVANVDLMTQRLCQGRPRETAGRCPGKECAGVYLLPKK